MTYYNRKEEVLEVKLTPYGRYLLSSGELRPVYYSFFDDDILYDSRYAFSASAPKRSENIYDLENQNDIEKRIKETPRFHCQTTFGERKSTQPINYTGSGPASRIPQVNFSASAYVPIVGEISENSPTPLFDESLRTITEFGDDTFLEIRNDFILLEINEVNSTFEKEVLTDSTIKAEDSLVLFV